MSAAVGAAVFMLGSIFCVSMRAQAGPETAVVSQAGAKPKAGANKRVSPYARAAAQRERTGAAPAGRAPTMVQAIGKPHKLHAGAPAK